MSDDRSIDADTREQRPHPRLLHNYVSFIGGAIAVAALTSFVLLVLLEFTGGYQNSYSDLITYILVPSVLGFGIFVMLSGALWERRRRRDMSHEDIARYPVLDLNDPSRRRAIVTFLCVAFVFIFLTA